MNCKFYSLLIRSLIDTKLISDRPGEKGLIDEPNLETRWRLGPDIDRLIQRAAKQEGGLSQAQLKMIQEMRISQKQLTEIGRKNGELWMTGRSFIPGSQPNIDIKPDR